MSSNSGISSHPLEVKKATVLRTMKDYELYKTELTDAKSKYDSLKETGPDHELRRAMAHLHESTNVLEHTRKQLATYATDLDLYIREDVVPMFKSGMYPNSCKSYVDEAKKYLDEIVSKYPEVGFKYPRKST